MQARIAHASELMAFAAGVAMAGGIADAALLYGAVAFWHGGGAALGMALLFAAALGAFVTVWATGMCLVGAALTLLGRDPDFSHSSPLH
jgi:hypothetical protein